MQDYLYKKMYEVETTHWWFQAKKDIIIQLVKNKIIPQLAKSDKAEITIADVGCGVGLLLNSLADYGQVTGIDYSDQAIEFCRNSFSGELLQKDFGIENNLEKKYDLVIVSDLLEHIEDDRIAITNIYNMLKPGGYAIITVPAFQFLWSQHDVNNMHFRRYCLDDLKRMISLVPLKINYISYYNFFLFHIAVIVRLVKKLFNLDKTSNLELTTPPSFINRLLYRTFYSESKYINKGKKFPYGLSLVAVLKASGD